LLEIRHVRDEQSLRNAYNSIYEEKAIRHTDSFYRWVLKLLRPKSGKRLLDIACGQGRLPQMAASMGLKAHGVDISVEAIRVGHGVDTQLIVANGQQLPYPTGIFDYITNIGSLEHYVDPNAGALEMARVLAADGRACILLPNTFSLLGNVLYAFHTGRTADDGQPIQRYAARYEWQDLLEAQGLKVVRTYKYECEPPTLWKDLIGYLRRPKAFIRLLLTPFLPVNLANSFVYICQRVE
jgi:SAM-dependent methyltransferase